MVDLVKRIETLKDSIVEKPSDISKAVKDTSGRNTCRTYLTDKMHWNITLMVPASGPKVAGPNTDVQAGLGVP